MLRISIAEEPDKSAITEAYNLLEWPFEKFLLTPVKPITSLIHLETIELDIELYVVWCDQTEVMFHYFPVCKS